MVSDVHFQTPQIPVWAAGAFEIDARVSQFSRRQLGSSKKFAVQNERSTHPCSERHADCVLGVCGSPLKPLPIGQRVGIILQNNGYLQALGKQLAHWYFVPPDDVGKAMYNAVQTVHKAGKSYSYGH